MKPKILFKGFEDDVWISSQFEEIFELIKNNSLSRAELSSEGRIGNIHYGDVLVKYGECLDTSSDSITYIHNDEIGEDLYRRGALKSGDIIFADAAEDNTVGKCSELICNDEEQIVSGLHTIACRPKIEITKRYLGYYLNSNAYHNQLLPHIQGTKVSSISRKAIVTTSIVYPFAQRVQELIATYFYRLDNLISTSTSRLASLKQVKEASLQAMFPQKGETVPKIRFKGFEGEWTKVKLNDICFKKASNLSESSLGIDTGQYAVYGASGYLQNISTFDIPSEYVGIIKDGSGVGRTKVYPAFTSILGTMQYILAKEDNNIRFIAALFENIDFSTFISGSGIPHIYFRDYGEIYVMIPSLVEQQAIASYFTSLDKQIALQTQQLEKLRQIKAACLDKMFV